VGIAHHVAQSINVLVGGAHPTVSSGKTSRFGNTHYQKTLWRGVTVFSYGSLWVAGANLFARDCTRNNTGKLLLAHATQNQGVTKR